MKVKWMIERGGNDGTKVTLVRIDSDSDDWGWLEGYNTKSLAKKAFLRQCYQNLNDDLEDIETQKKLIDGVKNL